MPTLVTIYGSSLSVFKYYQLIEDGTEEAQRWGKQTNGTPKLKLSQLQNE